MRTTVSLDKSVVSLAKKVAAKERRSFSNLVEVALDAYVHSERTPEIKHATAELRALGADPVMALRDKIAEVQRDQFLSTSTNETKTELPAPPVFSEPQLRHSPAASRVLASRATARPALRVG